MNLKRAWKIALCLTPLSLSSEGGRKYVTADYSLQPYLIVQTAKSCLAPDRKCRAPGIGCRLIALSPRTAVVPRLNCQTRQRPCWCAPSRLSNCPDLFGSKTKTRKRFFHVLKTTPAPTDCYRKAVKDGTTGNYEPAGLGLVTQPRKHAFNAFVGAPRKSTSHECSLWLHRL